MEHGKGGARGDLQGPIAFNTETNMQTNNSRPKSRSWWVRESEFRRRALGVGRDDGARATDVDRLNRPTVCRLLTVGLICASLALAGAPWTVSPTSRAQGQEPDVIAVLDLWPGTSSSAPAYLTPLGDVVLFSAADGPHGRELWVSDGTEAGTQMLVDIRPGIEGSNPIAGGESEHNPVPLDARTHFTQVGGQLYFVADDGVHGREIWLTDGTADGTRMLADVTEGAEEWGVAAFLTAHDGRLFFVGDNGFDGEEPWVSDGTADGTAMIADVMEGPAGSWPKGLASTAVGLAFAAEHFDAGVEPWVTDGTTAGTVMLGDLVSGLDGSNPSSFVGHDGALLFAASDVAGDGNQEPWTSNGTAAGTRMLVDLNPSGSGFNGGFTPLGDALYFAGDNGEAGSEIWRTDGTAEGTRMVADVASRGRASGPTEFAGIGNLLFFSAFHFAYGIEPWFTDGTPDGTRLLDDINPGSVPSSRPAEGTERAERLYFSADRDGEGRELWSTDGSSAGTKLVADLLPGAESSAPTGLRSHAGLLFFAARGAQTGVELHILGGDAPPPAGASPTAVPTITIPTPAPTDPSQDGPTIYMPYGER